MDGGRSPKDLIQMAHGGGGRWMHRLLEEVFYPAFSNPALDARHDGAEQGVGGERLAFTTDSYVVHPLFFPGGSIGELAVFGTVNDLAMCGARPLALSAAFILEEGLPIETLRRVVEAMREAAERARVPLVTGDTKVVDKGRGDGLYVNTSGIGRIETPLRIGPASVRAGDAVLLSGDVGNHGIAVLSVREGLEFGGPVSSDAAPLWEPVEALLAAGVEVHCLRDLTRGGLASAVNEIASAGRIGIRLEEGKIPVEGTVAGACEILGLDPLYVANEGRFVAFVPADQAQAALGVMRRFQACSKATIAGRVVDKHPETVVLETAIGGSRVLDLLSGEQMPRIC